MAVVARAAEILVPVHAVVVVVGVRPAVLVAVRATERRRRRGNGVAIRTTQTTVVAAIDPRVCEVGVRPRRRRVARLARCRIARLHMIRVGRALIIIKVARGARAGLADVHARGVAFGARVPGVRVGQREARRVLERCGRPHARVVALVACRAEASRCVIGLGRGLVQVQVA